VDRRGVVDHGREHRDAYDHRDDMPVIGGFLLSRFGSGQYGVAWQALATREMNTRTGKPGIGRRFHPT